MSIASRTLLFFLAASPLACGSSAKPPAETPAAAVAAGAAGSEPTEPPAAAHAAFTKAADAYLEKYLEFHPQEAVAMGLHEYDGRVGDRSATALATRVEDLKRTRAALEALDGDQLGKLTRVERDALLAQTNAELFELDRLRSPWRNPMYYLAGLDVVYYVARDYAPLETRAKAVASVGSRAAALIDQASANLQAQLPRPFVETALMQVKGSIDFVRKDVAKAFVELKDKATRAELKRGLDELRKALTRYRDVLVERRKQANDDWRLGEERFLEMLKATQGFDLDLATLERVARADLERNQKAIVEAARKIDPDKSVQAVIASLSKPRASRVLAVATEQASKMREFLIAKDLVTIPSEDAAEVRETPPFMRWNFAFLSSAGVFEPKPLPSFYYITPPDPTWPRAKQLGYVPQTVDLLFTTIHEVWPGHFLHGLHLKRSPSKYLKSAWNYTTGEGWAHYTEEMMLEQGVGGGDPRVQIGQLTNALLRNVRFLSTLGMHAGRMTIAESEKLFREAAYQDAQGALQQATRATFDPMYLAYTVGKLAIFKLRADWKAKMGDRFSLKAFHDELLSHGAAPLPSIRRAMLGANAGPAL